MEKSSARSLMEYSPVLCIRASSSCWRSESLGCLPRSLPLERAMAMPSRVRWRIRSASNSAKVARMLKKSLPIGSVGSWTVAPSWSLMSRSARVSPICRASGTERARRSSFETTRVSPVRTAARAWLRPGLALFRPVKPWSV